MHIHHRITKYNNNCKKNFESAVLMVIVMVGLIECSAQAVVIVKLLIIIVTNNLENYLSSTSCSVNIAR